MSNFNSIPPTPKRKSSLYSATSATSSNRSFVGSVYDRTKNAAIGRSSNIGRSMQQQQNSGEGGGGGGGAIRNLFQSIYLNRSNSNNSTNTNNEQQQQHRTDTNDDLSSPLTTSEYFKRYELMTEYINLRNPNHCPLGIYVLPSEENFYEWYGIIFVHKGYYRSGAFKFIIDIPHEYPNKGPSIRFLNDMFHPLVDTNGAVNISQQFPVWRPYQDYIFHLLHYVKSMFKKAVLEKVKEKHSYNKEAYRLYKLDKSVFAKLSYQCAQLSISDTYLYDTYPIQFSPLSDAKFDELKALMLRSALRPDEILPKTENGMYSSENAAPEEEADADVGIRDALSNNS
ncbi:ubiquitin-conjugating enzyme/RWD-like protein [Mycotypha africana]|uniref:ubiquitin-conjugating enzyme/RWD-like protein n=1 Tax=Mycotypha africana TaxID=64632 RepID=UPI0023013159|nr:ubiquitin-conjugating enzyme/RWD-like protein [Mycotypha africana]KAI8975496.1 ubiquitin-conjugating enzyme/RWD-like protein [Mycotypha africana]